MVVFYGTMAAQKSPKRKHIPTRSCVVCRQKFDKRDLIRVVYTESGLVIDTTGKMNGRGAYLCHQTACWERATSTNLLDQALRTVLTDEDRNRLRQAIPYDNGKS